MAKQLGREELTKIVYGSSFYGGGGGGASEEGLALIEAMYQEDPHASIQMIDISEMEEDPDVVSTMVAALGSPVATKGKTFQEESVNAVKGMSGEAGFLGKKLKYVYSGEMGGGKYPAAFVRGVEMRPADYRYGWKRTRSTGAEYGAASGTRNPNQPDRSGQRSRRYNGSADRKSNGLRRL